MSRCLLSYLLQDSRGTTVYGLSVLRQMHSMYRRARRLFLGCLTSSTLLLGCFLVGRTDVIDAAGLLCFFIDDIFFIGDNIKTVSKVGVFGDGLRGHFMDALFTSFEAFLCDRSFCGGGRTEEAGAF